MCVEPRRLRKKSSLKMKQQKHRRKKATRSPRSDRRGCRLLGRDGSGRNVVGCSVMRTCRATGLLRVQISLCRGKSECCSELWSKMDTHCAVQSSAGVSLCRVCWCSPKLVQSRGGWLNGVRAKQWEDCDNAWSWHRRGTTLEEEDGWRGEHWEARHCFGKGAS